MRARCWPALLVLLFLALGPLAAASAQGIPATPVPGDAPAGVLAEFPIGALPGPHAEAWFLRTELEPGGIAPTGKQIGPVVTYVESGELTLFTDQPVTVSAGAAATPGAVTASPAADAFQTVLRADDSVLVADGTTLTVTNTADEPATFLTVLLYAAEREGEAGEGGGEPVGLTQQGISIASAELPDGPGTLTMERVVVEPGGTLENDTGHGMGINGLELGAIEQGSVEATFEMGASWRWPGMLTAFPEPQPIDPGATVELVTGDGYWTYDGSSTWVVTGDEPLVLLRVVIMPGR
jgi:hypothetical protein